MKKIKAPIGIDPVQIDLSDGKVETKYGLPQEVKFCTRCVISNQRPNSAVEYKHIKESKKETIRFDEEGVCDACRVSEAKKAKIDWDRREKELRELCDKYRKNDGTYDCIVPGSGGKDSFYAAHMLKYKYGMHPLTVTWAPHIYTTWGWHNFQAWLGAGFDNFLCTPNPRTHRLLTRLAVENLFHPFQPFMFGQKSLAPKMALLHNVKLVFFGENEAEYGNPISDTTSAKAEEANGADPEDIEKKKVEVHYLGYYLKWHPQECYYYAVENGGFEPSPERTPGTYSKYNSIDDRIDDFHYYTTYIKFGIGRATYDASQEIRNEEITRDEGVALVQKFDGEFPERFAEEIFRYLSITEREYPIAHRMFEQPVMDRDYFMRLADQFRSPHLWKQEDGKWKLRHTVFNPGK